MAIIQFPDSLSMSKQTWGQRRNAIVSASAFGGSQSRESSHPVWEMTITPPPYLDAAAGAYQALMLRMKGHINLLACHNLRRPVPLGTMRGTMTVNADVAAGSTTMQIAASDQAGMTLLAGDYLGIGSDATQQVIMVLDDAVADVDGIITITFEAPLRTAFLAGESVTWNKPKVLWRRIDTTSQWEYEQTIVSADSMSFVEDWRL